ncbi:MAG: NfeD family protein [Thiohalorhabdus sp.]|uniref:NfeD family protein n=1 Tax=Thiohalorhabdus sp. TaxID=3094134 RepID=UPI0039815695
MAQRRLFLRILGVVACEGALAAGAGLLWGGWGLAAALAVILAVGDLPVVRLLDRHLPARLGREALPGCRGQVAEEFRDAHGHGHCRGRVRLQGALWSARLDPATGPRPGRGELVLVSGLEGLTLVVRPDR